MVPRFKRFMMLALLVSFFGAGCTQQTTPPATVFPQPAIQPPPQTQTMSLPDFMERRRVVYPDGRVIEYLISRMDPEKWSWAMANDPAAPKTVARWRQDLDANLMINGSYFAEDMQPTGFYQLNGQVQSAIAWPNQSKQNDPQAYTGLVRIQDGELWLGYLPHRPQEQPAAPQSAFLSFPTLIAGGFSLIKEDSKKYAHRTVLAMDKVHTPYIIITESGSPSLYELAVWLSEQPEKFDIAINLDGGTSTGLSYQDEDTNLDITSASIPNVIYLHIKS